MGCIRILTRADFIALTSGSDLPEDVVAANERVYDTAVMFAECYDRREDVEQVLDHALGSNFIYRIGARHQMETALKVAEKLGPSAVAFEVPVAGKHAVDVEVHVSGDRRVAIECKAALSAQISSGSVYKGISQGEIYLEAGYDAAIVVCPDGTLSGDALQASENRAQFSEVVTCELHELPAVLSSLTSRE